MLQHKKNQLNEAAYRTYVRTSPGQSHVLFKSISHMEEKSHIIEMVQV